MNSHKSCVTDQGWEEDNGDNAKDGRETPSARRQKRERERESKTEEGEIKSDVKVVKESTEVWSKGGDEE